MKHSVMHIGLTKMSAVKGLAAEYNWKGERLVHVSQSQDVYDSQMW